MEAPRYENKLFNAAYPKKYALIYVGEGYGLTGVPKKDLTREEAEALGGVDYLESTGYYAYPEAIENDGG